MPATFAICRVLQCVQPCGVVSSVRVTISSTFASPILRGAPGRGSSSSPSSLLLRKRALHLHPVASHRPSSRATSWLSFPSAHARTMRARSASCCEVLPRRVYPSSSSRSSSVSTSGFFGLPTPAYVVRSRFVPMRLEFLRTSVPGHQLVELWPLATIGHKA